jgi:methyl-accepting chemotaxis protein
MNTDVNTKNYENAIAKLSTGYNKSITLTSVTINSLKILDASMEQVQNGLSSIVSAFEEIRAGSASTSENAGQINTMMDAILRKNGEISQDIAARVTEVENASKNADVLTDLFEKLETQTKNVAGITGSIKDVADRTSILAINASIEAARAGKVGAGFRIIANEVRNLATQTGDFAKEITSNIDDFKTTVNKINKQMNEFTELLNRFHSSFGAVLSNFNENAQTVDQSGKSLAEITGAIREESQALNEGLVSLEKVNVSMKDTHTMLGVIQSSHTFLDDLLGKENR